MKFNSLVLLNCRNRILNFFNWFPRRRWVIFAVVEEADEIPEFLPKKGIVLVGVKTAPKWIVFDCPCRTNHRIMLNADRSTNPYWSINSFSQRQLTIQPSVEFRSDNKYCHFFVQTGKTIWVTNLQEWQK